MSIPGYAEWAKSHLTAFGLLSEASSRAVLAWEPTFAALQADAEELHGATAVLLARSSPIEGYLDGHRAGLLAAVRAGRAAAPVDADDDGRPVCVRCSGTGRLIVPHLRGGRAVTESGHWVGVLVGGRAQYATCAVRCSCERGKFGRFTRRDGVGLPTLAEYERRNPHWREQDSQRSGELAAEGKARGPADQYDAALSRIVERNQGGDEL